MNEIFENILSFESDYVKDQCYKQEDAIIDFLFDEFWNVVDEGMTYNEAMTQITFDPEAWAGLK